jgi:hypothetical protein
MPDLNLSEAEKLVQEIFDFEQSSPDESQFSIEEQQARRILTALEARFWTGEGEISAEFIDACFERYQVPSYNRDTILDKVQKGLYKRGIAVEIVKIWKKTFHHYDSDLDPSFVLAVNLILTTADKRSLSAKLKTIGVSPQKWEAYLRNGSHRDYFETRLKRTFGDADFYAKLNLSRSIESGDLNAIKFYYEVTGKYSPQSESNDFLKVILQLMEILAKHLNPEILDVVSREFDGVLQKELAK